MAMKNVNYKSYIHMKENACNWNQLIGGVSALKNLLQKLMKLTWSLYNNVVLPAPSRPKIKIRISREPKSPRNMDINPPISVVKLYFHRKKLSFHTAAGIFQERKQLFWKFTIWVGKIGSDFCLDPKFCLIFIW